MNGTTWNVGPAWTCTMDDLLESARLLREAVGASAHPPADPLSRFALPTNLLDVSQGTYASVGNYAAAFLGDGGPVLADPRALVRVHDGEPAVVLTDAQLDALHSETPT